MGRVRTSVIVAVAACFFWAGGCNLEPAERVELYEQQLLKIETLLAEHGPKVDALQAALDEGLAMVQDANFPMEARQKTWQTMQKVRDVLVDAVEYKARLETWLAQTKAAIEQAQVTGTVDAAGELGLIGGAVTQGGKAIGGAVGSIVGLVGLGISLLGNWLQKRTNTTLTATATAIVKGVEAAGDAADAVKVQIEEKMKAAGVFDAGNAIVDSLKV